MNSLAPVASPAGVAGTPNARKLTPGNPCPVARLAVTEGATVDLPMKTLRLRFPRFFSCKTARYFTPPKGRFFVLRRAPFQCFRALAGTTLPGSPKSGFVLLNNSERTRFVETATLLFRGLISLKIGSISAIIKITEGNLPTVKKRRKKGRERFMEKRK